MAIVVMTVYSALETFATAWGNILSIAVCTIAGVVVYAIMLILLRVKEFTDIIRRK